MIQVNLQGKTGYSPAAGQADTLVLEKGYCHFTRAGQKDFVNAVTAYEPQAHGALFETVTFRGRRAVVRLSFPTETVMRLTLLPEGVQAVANPVFSFPETAAVTVEEDETFLRLRTARLTVSVRKLPWEVSVALDGAPLVREQIADFNVDQRYKSLPLGFAVDDAGKVVHCYETMYLHCDESFYGFGEKFTDFNKRGRKITVWQRDAASTNSDESYKAMPYFMSTEGYSVLLNTYTRTHFNMGADSAVSYTMEAEDPCLDYYLFCNRDYRGLLMDYTALSGRSPMIPRWAFGFWMSKMSYITRQEVEETVDKMASFGMSADVIHIDGWGTLFRQDTGELLTFDEERFPDPAGMVRHLAEKGIHLSLWMFPYVHEKNRDGTVSASFENMKARGFLVKNREGEVYCFTPGEGDASHLVAALDFTNPALVEYMTERVGKLMELGVGVIKTDFSEEIPEDAVLYDGSTGLEAHNKYPLLYAKTIYEASKKVKEPKGEQALLWGRSGYLGSQNYPANWAGDSSAARNNLCAILHGGLSMGLSGVSFWGFDIGGFYHCDYTGRRIMPDDVDYIRSVQMGLMSPLSRSHGQMTPREPWHYSAEAQAAFLKINKFRYRLLPYLYSTAYETHNFGLPMMRALLLEFQDDLTVRHVADAYMLGEALLVAPTFDQTAQAIYLPAGSWLDLNSRRREAGGCWLRRTPKLDEIALYLRENRCLYLLHAAPAHIAPENFADLTVVMNLTDRLSQRYYDDGVEGYIEARLTGDSVAVTVRDVPVARLELHTPVTVHRVTVNGAPWRVEISEHATLATRGV